MVLLPRLRDYSTAQVDQFRQFSAAGQRYLELISQLDSKSLHFRRHEKWLECALATLFATASTENICAAWSETADQVLREAWQTAGFDKLEAGLFALGKLGAKELNLSSDVDLIVVAAPQHQMESLAALRRFQEVVGSVGSFGFCFRLDFDLRAGGKSGPMITTPSQFEDHYWKQGEAWERMALVRLRPIAGPHSLNQQIQSLANKFSYRKFLDYTLLEDLKAIRQAVHQQGFTKVAGMLHLKLEVGGIRDIELFVHALLVLNGGKIKSLQTASTSQAVELLRKNGLLQDHEAQFLLQAYWQLRHFENLEQAKDDRQTHNRAVAESADLLVKMQQVDQIVSGLLGPVDLSRPQLMANVGEQTQWLKDAGFGDRVITELWPKLMEATALSYKTDRDERARQEFLVRFIEALKNFPEADRDLGFAVLVDFVRAIRAKATFFALLNRTPQLILDLTRLFCLSPYLSQGVCARPELLDHFILQIDEPWAEDWEALIQQALDRKWIQELWTANAFMQNGRLEALLEESTTMADRIALQILDRLKKDYPQSSLEIITMGKWGGRELGLRSDLDFIFVTPQEPNDHDLKVARRFIARLTDPARGGKLYDVDTRLRPEGRSGALLVSRSSLADYWSNRIQPWERQAYLRARPLDANTEWSIESLLAKGLSSDDQTELKSIQLKLIKGHRWDDLEAPSFDLKYAPDGLLQMELEVQTAVLFYRVNPQGTSFTKMVEALMHAVPEWRQRGASLLTSYNRLRRAEQMLQICSPHKVHEVQRQSPLWQKCVSLLKE